MSNTGKMYKVYAMDQNQQTTSQPPQVQQTESNPPIAASPVTASPQQQVELKTSKSVVAVLVLCVLSTLFAPLAVFSIPVSLVILILFFRKRTQFANKSHKIAYVATFFFITTLIAFGVWGSRVNKGVKEVTDLGNKLDQSNQTAKDDHSASKTVAQSYITNIRNGSFAAAYATLDNVSKSQATEATFETKAAPILQKAISIEPVVDFQAISGNKSSIIFKISEDGANSKYVDIGAQKNSTSGKWECTGNSDILTFANQAEHEDYKKQLFERVDTN